MYSYESVASGRQIFVPLPKNHLSVRLSAGLVEEDWVEFRWCSCGPEGPLTHQWRAMAPAPAAMDVDDEGAGGGARNQSTMVVVKSDCTNTDPPLVVGPEPVEDEGGGGDTTECSSSFGDTCSEFQDAAGDGEPEVNSGMSARADGGRPWKPPR